MKILAVESTAKAASVAIAEDGKICGEFFSDTNQRHSRTLMLMAEALLRCTGVSPSEIDAFAVSNGPGSFTGVRIGVSCVKGMAMPFGTKCVGVSSLLTAAYPLKNSGKLICATMDARCKRVYNAFFKSDGEKLVRLSEDSVCEVDELLKKCGQYGEPPVFIGDGTDIIKAQSGIITAPGQLIYQRASSAALAAEEIIKDGGAVSPRDLLPVYLSVPSAQKQLKNEKEI